PRPVPVTPLFRDQFVILDQNGRPIPCPPGSGDTCGPVPYGTLDRTETRTVTFGVSGQATSTGDVFGHGNHFTLGASLDPTTVDFAARRRLGFTRPALPDPTASAGIPGLGSIIHTQGDVGVGPVGLSATSPYGGLYVLDTFDMTDRLSATLGGRLN